jgi:hypothetical protein
LDKALELVTAHFVESRDFNGISASLLSERLGHSWPELLPHAEQLLREGKIVFAFYNVQDNPHVLRLKPPPIERQLELLRSEEPDAFCVYLTEDVLVHRKDLDRFDGQPFTRRLALGEPQLEPVFFELAVLESYFRDPRYHFAYWLRYRLLARSAKTDTVQSTSSSHDLAMVIAAYESNVMLIPPTTMTATLPGTRTA